MLLVPRRRQARTLTLCVSSNRFDLLFLRLRIVVRIIFVVHLWTIDVQMFVKDLVHRAIFNSLADRSILSARLLNVYSDDDENYFLHSHVWNYVDVDGDDDDGEATRSAEVLFVWE